MSAERQDQDFERSIRKAYERPVPVRPLDEIQLLRSLRGEPRPRRGGANLLPRVTISLPAAAGFAVAFLLAGILAGAALERRASSPSAMAPSAGAQVIHFALVAPRASQVTVVGDFNGWDPAATPMRKLSSGATWTAAIAVPEGRYAYAFVIDGRTWMPDPTAPLAPGDGFGHESSVLVVPGARSSS